MIKTKTVFILGAGASKPYGYPTGEELYWILCDGLQNPNNEHGIIYRTLLNAGYAEEKILNFRSALLHCGKVSVDSFLEHREEYRVVGKAAIATALILNENSDFLFSNVPDGWYRRLYKILNSSPADFTNNQVAFITFNFDRTLEHFLVTALRESYGLGFEECAEKMKKIPIIHTYGKLNDLPWESSDGRPYSSQLNKEVVLNAAARIRIIHEDVDIEKDATFLQIQDELSKAKRICFIGFGYDAINLQRLRIKRFTDKVVIGTTAGISYAERSRIYRDSGHVIKLPEILGAKAVDLLEEYDFSTEKWLPEWLRRSKIE